MSYYPELTVEDCIYFRIASYQAWSRGDKAIFANGEPIGKIYDKTNHLDDFTDFERYSSVECAGFVRKLNEKLDIDDIRKIKKVAKLQKEFSRRRLKCSTTRNYSIESL